MKTIFTAPGSTADPVPERRTGILYTVFRDTRGGQSWREWPFFVCDDSLTRAEHHQRRLAGDRGGSGGAAW